MDPDATLRLTFRVNLDEGIPVGGTDGDTLFTDSEVDDLISISRSIEEATWRGWLLKGVRVAAGAAGGLVSATMGSEQFRWSDPSKLWDLAQKMVDFWWLQIPADLLPSIMPGSRLISIDGPPVAGVNAPACIWPDQTEWLDASRLMRRGWRVEGDGTW